MKKTLRLQKITSLTSREAKNYFLKGTSYINFDIPNYFDFEPLLTLVNAQVANKKINSLFEDQGKNGKRPQYQEGVNYTILSNKDGAYSWRPMQIIHPVLYVYLVNKITTKDNWKVLQKKFLKFSKSYVSCISIPSESTTKQSDKASQIREWWEKIEQYSIKMALEYNYVFATDISDCYGSIYTHSFEWAIGDDGKDGAKLRMANRTRQISLGSEIDEILRMMNFNQTNGIPQGSNLMDFLAEIILGHADEILTKEIKRQKNKIKKNDFKIIRYRDDYRIFAKNPNIGHIILKLLSTVLYSLGLKMNSSKTTVNNDIILSSIKGEKLERIYISPSKQHLQKEALRIYQLSKKYPNSGMISKELSIYFDELEKMETIKEDIEILITIITMVAFTSPKVIPWASAISSVLLDKIKSDKNKKKIIDKIYKKFQDIPNTGLIEIWLQRISTPLNLNYSYQDTLTKVSLLKARNSNLWNNNWLDKETVTIIDIAEISSLKEKIERKSLSPVIQREEVELFKLNY